MQNFQGTFETRKRSFISAFSICMTVPLNVCSNLLKIREKIQIIDVVLVTVLLTLNKVLVKL